jgi:Phage late-transcription coactivator
MNPKHEEMESFSSKIISMTSAGDIGYIDAITEYCENVGLEVDIAAKLITPFIKSKIAEEAMRNNLIEKIPVLPI